MTKQETTPKTERVGGGGRNRGGQKEKPKPQTKIVVRHLPPTMTEEECLQHFEPLPKHDFFYFAPSDNSLGSDATCRAYIALKNYDDVFLFRDRFDGYVFVDSMGAEYPAIVEFAPFQGLLKNKSRRTDNKVNTIEEESHYQQFLVKLAEEREAAAKGESKLEFMLYTQKEAKITSTPLLQYLANKKEKRREEAKKRMEEKRRQRDEEKDKRQQQVKIFGGTDGAAAGGKKQGGGKERSRKAVTAGDVADTNGNEPPQEESGNNSRSKRRSERNQRRHEQHMLRKREHLEREQKEKGGEAGGGNSVSNKEEDGETATGNDLTAPQPDVAQPQKAPAQKQQQPRKDGKRYSEKRERNRNRRDNKDKEKDKQKAPTDAGGAAHEPSPPMDDSTLNFSGGTANELQPGNESTTVAEPNSRKLTASANDSESQREAWQQRCAERQRERNAEERRIRNKDRPSIAIYQPKARLRASEESDTSVSAGASKELRSQPTSDCESVKREEPPSPQPLQPIKKVARYSERRAKRLLSAQAEKPSETQTADFALPSGADDGSIPPEELFDD